MPDKDWTSVPERFARVVRATPDATAVRAGDARLSYAALDRLAARLAQRLCAAGVRTEEPVGVLLDRSVYLVAALLGVLRAGGAYVALDPRDPHDRLAALRADAGIRFVVTEPAHLDRAGPAGGALLVPEAFDDVDAAPQPEPPVNPRQLAYIAYTSGSTGRPKGVCVPHRAVTRLVVGTDYLSIGPDDVFFQYAPVAFDASTLEIWGPLLNGASLVLAPPGELSAAEIVELVGRAGATVLWLTAGLFHQVVEYGVAELVHLRYLLAGGDVLSPSHVDRAVRALPNAVVVNGYGPTENTTFTCCYPVREPLDGRGVPIGRPINGSTVYLLDQRLEPVPDGAVGVLYAAGAGLARGYLNRPSLTAERFVPDPFGAPGSRMYDTGDLARRRDDGAIEFVGRVDDQVKMQGFRVEPGEVEAALGRYPDIAAVAVVAQHRGDTRRLVAFYESEFSIPSAELRRHLSAELPAYLIPAAFTWVEALPLNRNGKVDRAALAARTSRARPDLSTGYRAPSDPVEHWLVDLWQGLMEIDGIGVDDDFFELGGHSLMGTRMTTAILNEFDVLVSARTFYENPTIAELAAVVASRCGARR